jgi:hypothetical protein
MEDNSEPVQVFVRIRPEFDENLGSTTPIKLNSSGSWPAIGKLLHSPQSQHLNSCVTITDAKTLRITPPDEIYGSRKSVPSMDDKIYTFDRVFPDTSSQEEIYDSVAENVLAAVNGYNTTIFAYVSQVLVNLTP